MTGPANLLKNDRPSARVINLSEHLATIRLALQTDIKGVIELWANSATLRYFYDPVRWNWKGKAPEVWAHYASEIINDKNKFLVICDLKDNGLSGFMIARLEELPAYYQAKYSLTVEEFYLRPKDRKVEVFNQMVDLMLKEAYSRQKGLVGDGEISLKIEIIESDPSVAVLLEGAGFKKSSVTYTATVG